MEQHQVQELMQKMATKTGDISKTISGDDAEEFIKELLKTTWKLKQSKWVPRRVSKRVFVVGSGRSGLVAKAFAMPLMHLGLHAFVVSETTTPALKKGDVLVIFSKSAGIQEKTKGETKGETTMVTALAEKVKRLGGNIWLITSKANSPIGKNAHCTIVIEYFRDEKTDYESFAPLGTVFETVSMVFADAVISRIMEKTGTRPKDLQHTNLE
jgi:6-phospho-3-hexuloisomerase